MRCYVVLLSVVFLLVTVLKSLGVHRLKMRTQLISNIRIETSKKEQTNYNAIFLPLNVSEVYFTMQSLEREMTE